MASSDSTMSADSCPPPDNPDPAVIFRDTNTAPISTGVGIACTWSLLETSVEMPAVADPKFEVTEFEKLATMLPPPPAPPSVNTNPAPACSVLSCCNVLLALMTTYDAFAGAPSGSLAVTEPLAEYALYNNVLSGVVIASSA